MGRFARGSRGDASKAARPVSMHVFGYVICDFCKKGEEPRGDWVWSNMHGAPFYRLEMQAPSSWVFQNEYERRHEIKKGPRHFCSTKCVEDGHQADWIEYRKKQDERAPIGSVQCLLCYGYGRYTTPHNTWVLCGCHLYKGTEEIEVCKHCGGTGRVQTDCNGDSDICHECRRK